MPYKLVYKADYPGFVSAMLAAENKVIAPLRKERMFTFGQLESVDQMTTQDHYQPTLLPPKVYLFPPTEALLKFKLGDPIQVDPVQSTEPLILLEVRPCDINGLRKLDRFFLEDIKEENYARRREKTTILGLECEEPCSEFCFCESVGSLQAREGYDLLFSDQGEHYLVSIGAPRGAELLDKYATYQEAKPELVAQYQNAQAQRLLKFPRKIKENIHNIPLLLIGNYDHPIWKELGERDLSCGACNVTCPTCSCFDVADQLELNLCEGDRGRKWDGCMLADFAKVASGENFRKERSQRIRHRIYRKFNYQMLKYGEPFCVGCGRCSRSCLVKIYPHEVLNDLYQRAKREAIV